MSPAMFIILSDLQSWILAKAEVKGRISGVKISRTSSITHLVYVDDLLIYYKTDKEEALAFKECLDQYCRWFGQRINWEKSDMHFSSNVSRLERNSLCSLLSMRECSHSGKYLGNRFRKFSYKSIIFNHFVDRMRLNLPARNRDSYALRARTP